MARGIRKDTPERIAAARERLPLELGPWLGDVATRLNISAGLIARLAGAHEQTVLRWFFGVTPIQPHWLRTLSPLIVVLAWMHSSGRAPLEGGIAAKLDQLKSYRQQFVKVAKPAA